MKEPAAKWIYKLLHKTPNVTIMKKYSENYSGLLELCSTDNGKAAWKMIDEVLSNLSSGFRRIWLSKSIKAQSKSQNIQHFFIL